MNIRQILRPTIREQAAAAERKPQKRNTSANSLAQKKQTDRLTLSTQALSFLKEQNRLAWERKSDSENGTAPHLKALEKDLKKQDKCLKIASRLRKGDRVPPEDLRYLKEYDQAGYLLALSQRVENPHPKKWESVLDEEDLRELESNMSGGTDTAAAGIAGTGMESAGEI